MPIKKCTKHAENNTITTRMCTQNIKTLRGENTGNITGVNGKTFGWCRSISLLRKKLGV